MKTVHTFHMLFFCFIIVFYFAITIVHAQYSVGVNNLFTKHDFSSENKLMQRNREQFPDESRMGELAMNYARNPGSYEGQSSTQSISSVPSNVKLSEPNITGDSDFGWSMANAGDVNGDGYDDILVGAYHFNGFTGRAYVFYGGPDMDNIFDVLLPGKGDLFGECVAGAGDVNGDGYDDVLVGAVYGTGHAYLYLGGENMDNIVDVIMDGEEDESEFGGSVAGAGDVNNDGYDDFLVGSPMYNDRDGRVYVYFGGSNPDSTADIILSGGEDFDSMGRCVAGGGDVNNDGFDDILVGAIKNKSMENGRVAIFFGGSDMDNVADVILHDDGDLALYGNSLSRAGDVNNDGFEDILVGGYSFGNHPGCAYLYYGGEVMDNIIDVKIKGFKDADDFGNSVSGAGDINHDGFADILIGAPGRENGLVCLYYGGAEMDTTADIVIKGSKLGEGFGWCVAGNIDVDTDNNPDIIVSTLDYMDDTGCVNVYNSSINMDFDADVIISGELTANSFGYSVCGAGDVNNDGYNDVLVGASNYNVGTGSAYLYYGGPDMDTYADVFFIGQSVESYFGRSVAGIGDVNMDGFDDILVGAEDYNYSMGQAFLYFGGTEMDSTADLVFTGEKYFHYFGRCVSGAGDVNNDGYADFLIGADMWGDYTGRVYLYYGGPEVDNVADAMFSGKKSWYSFGRSAAGVGDVNGDGFGDILIGAYRCFDYTGQAYLYYGSAEMDTTADVVMTGEAARDSFGYIVAGAGDVNNDGFADMLINADGSGYKPGNVYIFFGGAETDSIPDLVFEGVLKEDYYFNNSISGAGDINQDGYDDFMIGSLGTNKNRGVVYLYYGSAQVDSVADFVFEGEEAGDYLGYSIASVGDINADGMDDIFISALYHGDNYNGAAYLYFGSQTLDVAKPNENSVILPQTTQLRDNYPNPFNPVTTISFDLPERTNVQIVIYDISGRAVRKLLHEARPAGQHQVIWDGRNDSGMQVSSGVYFYKFETDQGYRETKKMTLLK